MLSKLKFHHVGVVTFSIEETSMMYMKMGYTINETIVDEIQKTKICFLEKIDSPRIELIEPSNETSSVHKILNKNGVTPYHFCYEVEDIEKTYNELTEKEGFIPLFRPVEAIAFDNRLICYLYRKEIGYIEIVQK